MLHPYSGTDPLYQNQFFDDTTQGWVFLSPDDQVRFPDLIVRPQQLQTPPMIPQTVSQQPQQPMSPMQPQMAQMPQPELDESQQKAAGWLNVIGFKPGDVKELLQKKMSWIVLALILFFVGEFVQPFSKLTSLLPDTPDVVPAVVEDVVPGTDAPATTTTTTGEPIITLPSNEEGLGNFSREQETE